MRDTRLPLLIFKRKIEQLYTNSDIRVRKYGLEPTPHFGESVSLWPSGYACIWLRLTIGLTEKIQFKHHIKKSLLLKDEGGSIHVASLAPNNFHHQGQLSRTRPYTTINNRAKNKSSTREALVKI